MADPDEQMLMIYGYSAEVDRNSYKFPELREGVEALMLDVVARKVQALGYTLVEEPTFQWGEWIIRDAAGEFVGPGTEDTGTHRVINVEAASKRRGP